MSKFKPPRPGPGDWTAQMQRLQAELKQAQEELADQVVEASAGGGAVSVVMTGTQECRSIQIAPSLLQEGDVEMLQDLLVLAFNQAVRDSQQLAARRLGPFAAGMPGGMPGGLT
jgi:DNA-binding YbaB/EbfC family protein